jgi:hypothetical protein
MSLSWSSGTTTLRLQVDQALLHFLHRRDVARHDRAPGLACSGLLFDPFQVEQLAGRRLAVFVTTTEFGDEVFLAVAALVHHDAAQLALLLAHVVNLAAHHVAQLSRSPWR